MDAALRANRSLRFIFYGKKRYMGVKRSSKIIMTRAMRTAISVCLSLADGKRLPKSCEIDVTWQQATRVRGANAFHFLCNSRSRASAFDAYSLLGYFVR